MSQVLIILALVAFVILAVLAFVGGGNLWLVAAIGLALFAAGHLNLPV